MEVVPSPPSLSPTCSYTSLPDAPQDNINITRTIEEPQKQHQKQHQNQHQKPKKKRGRAVIAPFAMLAVVVIIVLL